MFSSPEWVQSRGSDRNEWKVDPCNFIGSAAWSEINNRVGGALDDVNTSGYSLGFDFANIFNSSDYSVGVILLRSEDHDLEIRSKRRYQKVVMIIPGLELPKSLDGYFGLVSSEFKKLGPQCIGGEGLEVTQVELDTEAEAAAAANSPTQGVAFRSGPRRLKTRESIFTELSYCSYSLTLQHAPKC